MTSKVVVVGSGTWGTAAAGLAARHSDQVVIWAHSPQVAEKINETGRNPRHLPDYQLPANVSATHSIADALAGATAMVVAVPSAYLRDVLGGFAESVSADLPIVVLTKGIEPGTHMLMTDIVSDVLGHPERVAALSGPNHAEEICLGKVSAAVVASPSEEVARLFQSIFVDESFRVYCTDDLAGVEVCAAVKNVVAIACGVCAGMGFGDNTLAVLMTRGLAEIGRIVAATGGNPLTCMGLAGMGDLVATCTSQHSRNRTFGESLAKGGSLADYERETGMVVEGARAALSVWELSRELQIEAPITSAVHAILYDGKELEEAIVDLLGRTPNEEFYGLGTRE